MFKIISKEFTDDSFTVCLDTPSSPVYITIEYSMIYVDKHAPDVMTDLVVNHGYMPDETYDTSDLARYYGESEYAGYIDSALLELVNKILNGE